MLSACELLGPKLHEKLQLEKLKEDKQPEIIYPELSNEGEATKGQSETKVELYPGTGNFLGTEKRPSQSGKPSKKGKFTLNFDGMDIAEVVKIILKEILGENYVINPKVSGNVTLQTSRPLTRQELLPALEILLQLNNAALVYDQGLYKIDPVVDAISGSLFTRKSSYRKKAIAGYQIRVIPVRNIAVEDLSEIIKPLLKEKTILHVDNIRNMMLIAGTSSELARAMEIVNTFDVDVMKGRSFGLFPLQRVDAAKIIEELEQIFNKKDQNASNSFMQFMEIERLNAILVITHRAHSLKDVERWVHRLDRANTTAGGGAIVYRVQHVNAVELAATLNEIFSQSNASNNRSASIAAGRRVVEITNRRRDEQANTETRSNLAVTSSIADLGEIKIIADEVNNALIIVATAQDYAVVQQVIQQLDVMPLQVLIDVTIVDVTLTNDLQYGIRWFFEHNLGENTGAGSLGGVGDSTAENLALAGALAIGGLSPVAGFGYGFISKSGDIRAVLTAEAEKENINIISSPSIMVLNNQEASIQVGQEVSLLAARSTPLTGGVGVDNTPIQTTTLEQRKTGVTIKVTPRVNANGLVIMEIDQKIEDIGTGITNGNPVILTRELISSVAVLSGETVVLGGLISESNGFVKSGIPFLHELPLIGPLFGTTSKNKQKTELVVLITPRVVKTRQDARLVTDEFKRKLSGIYEEIELCCDE